MTQLTASELALCRLTNAKYLAMDKLENDAALCVGLYLTRPKMENGKVIESGCYIGHLRRELFPSVESGVVVTVPTLVLRRCTKSR